MKRIILLAMIALLTLAVLTFTGCGKTKFGLVENTGKQMTITAANAGRDVFLTAGSLEVAEGERIVISGDMKKGAVRVEIFQAPEGQSIDTLPEMEGEPIIMANVSSVMEASGGVAAGKYLLRATCLEKATGTIRISVTPDS